MLPRFFLKGVRHWQRGLWSWPPSFTAATFLAGNDLSDSELGLQFCSLDGAQFSGFWHLVLALKSGEEGVLAFGGGKGGCLIPSAGTGGAGGRLSETGCMKGQTQGQVLRRRGEGSHAGHGVSSSR